MPLILWSSIFSIGVEQIDEQHRRMIAIANTLYEALTEHRGDATLGELFDELRDHIATHFASEEEYMERIGYPLLEVQRRQHQALADRAHELAEAHRLGQKRLSPEVMHLLRDWVTEHLLSDDRKIGEFVREQGLLKQ